MIQSQGMALEDYCPFFATSSLPHPASNCGPIQLGPFNGFAFLSGPKHPCYSLPEPSPKVSLYCMIVVHHQKGHLMSTVKAQEITRDTFSHVKRDRAGWLGNYCVCCTPQMSCDMAQSSGHSGCSAITLQSSPCADPGEMSW